MNVIPSQINEALSILQNLSGAVSEYQEKLTDKEYKELLDNLGKCYINIKQHAEKSKPEPQTREHMTSPCICSPDHVKITCIQAQRILCCRYKTLFMSVCPLLAPLYHLDHMILHPLAPDVFYQVKFEKRDHNIQDKLLVMLFWWLVRLMQQCHVIHHASGSIPANISALILLQFCIETPHIFRYQHTTKLIPFLLSFCERNLSETETVEFMDCIKIVNISSDDYFTSAISLLLHYFPNAKADNNQAHLTTLMETHYIPQWALFDNLISNPSTYHITDYWNHHRQIQPQPQPQPQPQKQEESPQATGCDFVYKIRVASVQKNKGDRCNNAVHRDGKCKKHC